MSRSVKGVREVLQHSKSGQQILNDDEKYNFVKDKSQSSQRNVSELIAKIESLEYDIVMLTDNLTAVQRNYDNVSRLLRQEREKDNNRDKMTSKRNDELEMMDMIERLKVMERDKAQIEESAMLKEKEQQMEVKRLNGLITDARNKLEAKTIEVERLHGQMKKLETKLLDDSKMVAAHQKHSELDKKYQHIVSELNNLKAESQSKDKSMQDVQKRLGVREADLKDRYTMIEKLKKEIDKYITENGDLKKTINELEKEMKAASKAVSENISSNTQKEDLLKSIEEDFEKQKVKINQLENELKSKNIEIVDMAKLSEIGKLFEKIKDEEGDCKLMGKRSMDQNKEMLSKLHKENKMLDDTIKKKNAKIVEMFQEIDKLVADINSRDASSDNLNQERNKLQQSLKKIEAEKSKLHENLTKKDAETRHWKEKFEKLQQEVKSKSNQLNDTQIKSQGLDGEIKNLKDQLDQKIQKMNSLSNKSSLLSETEKKLREEQLRIESLVRQNSEISGKLTQSEIELNDLNKKIKSKDEELEKALQDSSRRGSMQDFELNESRKTISSQEKLIEKLKCDLKFSQDQEKRNQNLLIETSSKLKGALMRLDAAEKTMAKYDLDHIDDKLKDLKAKGEAMGQAADRIKMAMNALKITVACKKCGKFPKDGKTLFPCAHSYCNGCFSDTVDQCLDCKAKVNIQVKNPLIEEINVKYGYMNDLVGVMIESSSIFTKPSLI